MTGTGAGRLDGKVSIVTGAASGIGAATARRFVVEGATVVLADVQEEAAEALAAELGAQAIAARTDVSDEASVAAVVDLAVERFGRLDVMVNNAGASFRARPEDISVNGWNTVIQINLNGVFLGCKWAGKQMM